MPDIHVLDSHVADLIAAGEVVERPASVAKELMENAVDAGATSLTVEISHGGMTFLRVTDNGRGIPADQLQTAFLRHATSKLRTEYDLEAIGTLGFRGEALAAISAVSRVEVMSRTPEVPLGASLSLEGGVPGPVEEAGCPLGTTMVVRDLFFNTPARLKFVKRDSAEGAAVFNVVQRVALSHPEVSVKFIRDGKQELLTPGDGQLKSAVYAVLGRDLALGFRPVRSSGEEMEVTGFVSMPACCRASRSWQYFFVNGRQVKSKLMMAALEEAYKNQKMVGKFPGCVLHLNTKLSAVDVNVHPAKTEVKFGSERQVFSAVYHGVLSALEADRSRPAMDLGEQTKLTPSPKEQLAAAQTKLEVSTPVRPAPRIQSVRPAPVVHTPSVQVRDSAARQTQPIFTPQPKPTIPSKNVETSVEKPTFSTQKPENPAYSAPAAPKPVEKPAPAPVTKPVVEEPIVEEPVPQLVEQTVPWRVAGEVLNTYIIVEQGDSVFFIDKHAAHERMNFDRMKAQGYDPMAQTLLAPAVCRFGQQEMEVLLDHKALLGEFGFDLDELGGQIAVRQAPFDVATGEIEETLTEIAQKLLTTGSADPSAARDDLLHTMACKAAIKGGWKTSPPELERIARAVMEEGVKYCPHGRPVAIELTRKELEKQFKRIT